MSVVQRRACKTCPFRRDATTWFDPAMLDATIGSNLRTGYAHNCHTTNEHRNPKVCAGFARLVVHNQIHNRMLGMAETLGIFHPEHDLDRVSDLETESWEAVLAMHHQRGSSW